MLPERVNLHDFYKCLVSITVKDIHALFSANTSHLLRQGLSILVTILQVVKLKELVIFFCMGLELIRFQRLPSKDDNY